MLFPTSSPDIHVHDTSLGLCSDGVDVCWIIGVAQGETPVNPYPAEVNGLIKAAQHRMSAAGAPAIGVEVHPATIIYR